VIHCAAWRAPTSAAAAAVTGTEAAAPAAPAAPAASRGMLATASSGGRSGGSGGLTAHQLQANAGQARSPQHFSQTCPHTHNTTYHTCTFHEHATTPPCYCLPILCCG
jgi:hypothetical protein